MRVRARRGIKMKNRRGWNGNETREIKGAGICKQFESRALSVLIYLIDRSNQELTCFPAIPTMAEQLHISISTVKRALRELVDAGYISKDARFREKNRGQSSNLYTLILQEEKQEGNKKDGSGDREKIELASDNSCDVRNKDRKDNQDMGKVEGVLEKGKVGHIDFDGMAGKKEDEKVVESKKKERKKELKSEISDFLKKEFGFLSIRESLLAMRKKIVICI